MPPPDATPTATIRYLSRLLSALCLMHPDTTLRIPQGILDRVAGEADGGTSQSPRVLSEDFDHATNEIVLRFRQQSLALYFVKDLTPCQAQPAPASSTTALDAPVCPAAASASATSNPSESPTSNKTARDNGTETHRSRIPLALSDELLARLERNIQRERMARALKARQWPSSRPSDSDSFV
jgi:hypothetical protein